MLLLLGPLPALGTDDRVLVLISIDGLRPDLVLEAERHGLSLPQLRRLLAEGAHARAVEPVLPAVTYPNHTTLVTGVSPIQHGIHNNRSFDPTGRNRGGWNWYAEDISVPTLWDVAERAGLRTASVDWPVTVGAHISYNIPQYWRAHTADDHKLLRALTTPGLLAEAEAVLGPYPLGHDYSVAADGRRAAFAAYLLSKKRPRLLLLHLGSFDAVAHAHGPLDRHSLAVLEKLDGYIGTVRVAAERASGGRAVIAVVSDHGFRPVWRTMHLNVALQEAGLITLGRGGQVSSWRAYAWPSCGSAAIVLADEQDRLARERVRALLERLAADPTGGILRIMDGAEARRRGGFPQAAFVVILRDGVEMGFRTSGPLFAQASGGTHGYAPDHPDMAAAFFVAGPGVPVGLDLGRIHMRDIAPTLAALLGLSLPAPEGRGLFPVVAAAAAISN